ncbi:MAG: ABC transporter substrate-binding protein [Coriobacteriia bacterium]|nr:ABC transporter substrate-binding protein [Coriobacteriia bacterium]
MASEQTNEAKQPGVGGAAANGQGITRRKFIECAGALAALSALADSGSSLVGCQVADRLIMHTQTIVDDAGRELQIPTADAIQSIFFTSSLAQVYIVALIPEKLGGTASKFDEQELEYLPEGIEKLPYMGTLHNNDEIDREALLCEDIDIMFSISGVGLTTQNISEAEEIQAQTGIPVVLVDGSFDKVGKAFRFLGDILDRKARAEELAQYVDRIYAEVSSVVKTIPLKDRIPVYYAEGPEGLQTEPETSQHMLAFLEAGATCVADCEETYGGGMTDVSLEQVLKWDPEVIIAWDSEIRGGAYDDILTNKNWADIKAVKTGRVYAMPNLPWAWCDRPPGVNRIMGLQWICNLLYPDVYNIDIIERTQEFFDVMLGVELTREQALKVVGDSYPPVPRVKL